MRSSAAHVPTPATIRIMRPSKTSASPFFGWPIHGRNEEQQPSGGDGRGCPGRCEDAQGEHVTGNTTSVGSFLAAQRLAVWRHRDGIAARRVVDLRDAWQRDHGVGIATEHASRALVDLGGRDVSEPWLGVSPVGDRGHASSVAEYDDRGCGRPRVRPIRASITRIVGAAVARERQRLGVSQSKLATAIGAGKTTVIQLEAGTCGVSISMLCRLALALGVEPGVLMPTADDLDSIIEPIAVLNRAAMTRTSRGGNKYIQGDTPRGDKYMVAVVSGVRKFVAAHGKPPPTNGRDATRYVGFTTTWTAINAALLKGSNGVPACGGLSRLIRERGLTLRGQALERAIEDGARAYASRYGRRPRARSGDASAFVGRPGTWATWDRALRLGRHGMTSGQGLTQFLDARGVHGPTEDVRPAHVMF